MRLPSQPIRVDCVNSDDLATWSHNVLDLPLYNSLLSFILFSLQSHSLSTNNIWLSKNKLYLYKWSFSSLPARVVCWQPLQTVWTQIRPDKMSGLIWNPNCLTLWLCSWKNFLITLILKIISKQQKSIKNYPACKELKIDFCWWDFVTFSVL